MKNRHVVSVTKAFLRVHWDLKKELLLAYSGGADSKALLYALIEQKVKPHIVHVDHSWREESAREAKQIEEEALSLGCSYTAARLSLKTKGEEEARKERYRFFASIASPDAALMLAHHQDDLAETVLKRVFEGAHLSHLSGMQKVSSLGSLTLWRPLLGLKKSDLLLFLKQRKLLFLQDSSNQDETYLRARMRGSLLPVLNRHFGKEIAQNLSLLSERSLELHQYLERKTASIKIYQQEGFSYIDLHGLDPLEQRHLLRKLAFTHSLSLNRSELQTLLTWVKKQETRKTMPLRSKKILVVKERVYLITDPSTCLY